MKCKTIKNGGARKKKGKTKKVTSSQNRVLDSNSDKKREEFLNLLNLPVETNNDILIQEENIKNYDCTKCNFQGFIFSQKNLSNANLEEANFSNTLFDGSNTKVSGSNLKGAIFNNTKIYNALFDKTKLNKAEFIYSEILSANFQYADLENTIFDRCIITNLSLDEAKLNYITMVDCDISVTEFESLDSEIIYGTYYKSRFSQCSFNNLKLNYINFLETVFYSESRFYFSSFYESNLVRSIIKDCEMVNSVLYKCNLSEIITQTSSYYLSRFTDCNIIKSDFRQSIINSSTFTDCNLTNSNWRNVTFLNNSKPFINCNLSNIDLQSSTGLNGMDFEGLNLQGAQLKGINLRESNFTNADLRGATFEFSDVQGANFEGANLQGTILVGIAINWQQALNLPRNARRNRAQDTHLAFNDIDFQNLLKFFIKYKIPIETEMKNEEFIKYISDNLKEYLNKLESDEKTKLTERLNACLSGRLDTWNYFDNLPGVDPKVRWIQLIYPMIQYINKQSNTFKDLYIQILITDSAEGHGQSFSCIKGIVERLLTTTGKVIEVIFDNESTKKQEYTELHMILSPIFTISTLFKEWLDIHKQGGNDPLDENDDPEKLTNSFLEYAKEQYNFNEKNEIEQKIILDKIYNDDKVGINKIKDKFGILYFFGGKSRRKKKSRKYKTLKKKQKSN